MGTRHWPEDADEHVEELEQQLAKANERVEKMELMLDGLADYLSDKNKFAIEQKVKGMQRVLDCRELNLSQGEIDTIKLMQDQLRKEQE